MFDIYIYIYIDHTVPARHLAIDLGFNFVKAALKTLHVLA